MSISSLLTRCPGCESTLIQMELSQTWGDSTLVARYCPECDHDDQLELPTAVADLLGQRAEELAECVRELANRLAEADGLWIYDPH
jgi:hypothetical protein